MVRAWVLSYMNEATSGSSVGGGGVASLPWFPCCTIFMLLPLRFRLLHGFERFSHRETPCLGVGSSGKRILTWLSSWLQCFGCAALPAWSCSNMRQHMHWLVCSCIHMNLQGRLWHCGSAAVGDEEACFAMPPAPVGTSSSGEPLPLHAGTVALLQQPDFLRTAFSNLSVGTNVRKCSSARLRRQLGCRRNVLATTSDRSLAWKVIFDIIAQGLLGPGPKPGDHQTFWTAFQFQGF